MSLRAVERVFFTLFLIALLVPSAHSQTSAHPQANRVLTQPSLASTTRLAGHIPGWVRTATDAGAVPAGTTLRVTFVLSRSTDREAAFRQLLADQQTPGSLRYHQWLTPRQVGQLYGPTQHDLDALTSWLAAQGFTSTEVAPSGIFVSASASAATVSSALSTSFHSYRTATSTKLRIATTGNPAIPSAFASLVTSITGLSETPLHPAHGQQVRTFTLQSAGPHPALTSGSAHAITPGDFATIYDVTPVYNSGIDGSGEKVAILGKSRVLDSDITGLQSAVGQHTKTPNVIVPPTGTDPGTTNDTFQTEATLDVDRVLGTAPGAQADLIVSGDIGSTDGLTIAAQYEVQTLLDPILNVSFSECEANSGPSTIAFWDDLFQQAASEGISVFVSAGDSGADACESAQTAPQATQARSINSLCSSSFVTCVGGTEFADSANPSAYWSSTNNSTTQASALSYIPEGAWNEPTTTASGSTAYQVSAGGGGASLFIPKPSWQSGTGVPSDGFRDIPDVSFSGSFHDGYLFCASFLNTNCTSTFGEVAGTSASNSSMAGIAALLDQRLGKPQGNLNPLLYRLAANSASAFHDATAASSGVSSCDVNTPSMCNNSLPGPNALTGGLAGYSLTTGYDQATGLGSLDVNNLLNAAGSSAGTSPLTATSVKLTASVASPINTTQTVAFTATVSPSTATGTVQIYANGAPLGSPIVVSGGAAVSPAETLPAGNYLITATYSGDATYAGSTSASQVFSVVSPFFTLAADPSTLSIAAGSSTTSAINVTSGGLSGSVALSCSVAYSGTATPVNIPTCSVAPSPVSLPLNGSASSTLTIHSTAPQAQLRSSVGPPPHPGASGLINLGRATLASLLLLTLLPRRRRLASLRSWRSLGSLLFVALTLGGLSACSGSSTPESPNPLLATTSATTVVATEPVIVVGTTDTFTATVTPATSQYTTTPTGTVQFMQGSTVLGSATLSNGKAASSPISFSSTGSFNITAVYSGDGAFYNGSTSSAIPLTVVPPGGSTPGSYTITVTGNGPAGAVASTKLTLTVH